MQKYKPSTHPMYWMLSASDRAYLFTAMCNAKHMNRKNWENNYSNANINVNLHVMSIKLHAKGQEGKEEGARRI